MPPHLRPVEERRQAAQVPSDSASIARHVSDKPKQWDRRAFASQLDSYRRQVFENVRPYEAFPVEVAPPSLYCHPLASQPFTGCTGSIEPLYPSPSTVDALGRPVRRLKLHAPSAGIHQGFLAPVQHDYDIPYQQTPVNSRNGVQLQTRLLLRNFSTRASAPESALSKTPRKSNKQSGHSPLQVAESGSKHHTSSGRNDLPVPNPGFSSPFGSQIGSAVPESRTPSRKDASFPNAGVQSDQGEASAIPKSNDYLWLGYDQQDPTVRSLTARRNEDNVRIDAIHGKGGSCGPCRLSKKQCDALDHCQRCLHRRIPSEAAFLALLQSASYTPGLENISSYNFQAPVHINHTSPEKPDSAAMIAAQEQTTEHVNSWFKNVTETIDSKPFYNDIFQREVALDITSGVNGIRSTCFNLNFLDISSHLELTAYLLDEKELLAGFMGHSSTRRPPAPKHGQVGSHTIKNLSWVISNTFAFLRSMADAEIYASINSMPAARVTVSVIYASLYRLLLSKSHDLCSFVLKSLQHDFKYCTRRNRKDVLEDSLRGLAQYHRVVTGLSKMELGSSSEVAALFSGLGARTRSLLENAGVEKLFMRIYSKIKPRSALAFDGTVDSIFERLVSSYSSEVPEINSLSIALRVNSGNYSLRPVHTEAFRDADPYHHHEPIKVRDLLMKSDGPSVDPKQIYVDNMIEDFDFLGRTALEQPGPSGSCPSFFVSQNELSYIDPDVLETPSTSLNPEHASIRPSQQDTETESVKSESTVQNDHGIDLIRLVGAPPKTESATHGWSHVPRGKGCKRRERSGDSQNSSSASGHGHRKHVKLDSGRHSPQPSNYFGLLTHEPAALR
jgi:hypothetical protein